MKNHSRRLNAARHTACFLFLAAATIALGQDAWRESAAARRASLVQKDSLQNNDYNIKAGPVLVKLNAAFGTEWNDNVTLSDKNASSDFALTPSFNIGAYWPISVNNTLSFNFGIGYIKYLDHPQLDQLIIAPSSARSATWKSNDKAELGAMINWSSCG